MPLKNCNVEWKKFNVINCEKSVNMKMLVQDYFQESREKDRAQQVQKLWFIK